MSSWDLSGSVTLIVALYIPSLHVLASVDTNWKHIIGCATRYIIDGFLCSNFEVHCLGDLFANESVSKHRLDKICRFRLGQPSDGIEEEVLFWYEESHQLCNVLHIQQDDSGSYQHSQGHATKEYTEQRST